jgi:hypothetical protein
VKAHLCALAALSLSALACEGDVSSGGGGVRVPQPPPMTQNDSGVRDGSGPDGGGGDNSGVDRNKFIDELTETEVRAVCEWSIAKQGGPGVKQCNEGMITVNTVEECIADYSAGAIHCQISLVEDCMTSLNGDACQFFNSLQCAAFFQCAAMQPDAGVVDSGGE